MFLSSSISSTSSSRNSTTVSPVNASVSPEVSGLRKLTPEVLNHCSAPSSAKNSTTPQDKQEYGAPPAILAEEHGAIIVRAAD